MQSIYFEGMTHREMNRTLAEFCASENFPTSKGITYKLGGHWKQDLNLRISRRL